MEYVRKCFPRLYRIFDREYSSYYQILKKTENMSFHEASEVQFLMFKDMFDNAYYNSTYYKRKFDRYGITPPELKEPVDIARIPVTEKSEIRENIEDILSKDCIKRYAGKTSGTTGSPIQFYYSRKSVEREWATITYQWERIGFYPWLGRIELRGVIENEELFTYLPGKVLRINIVRMNSTNIGDIQKEIIKSGFSFIHGYPSAFLAFLRLLGVKNDLKKIIRGIMLASEVVHDNHISVIKEGFPEAEMTAHYGQAERQCMAAWDKDAHYCFHPLYGLVEFAGKQKEIIATGFNNAFFPLIRYRTSDSAGKIISMKGRDGFRLFPVVKNINGRLEDLIYNKDKEIVPPAIITFPLKDLKYIIRCRLIQRSLLLFEFQYVADDKIHENDIEIEVKQVVFSLKKILGDDVEVETRRVEELRSDDSGKFRWIINEPGSLDQLMERE